MKMNRLAELLIAFFVADFAAAASLAWPAQTTPANYPLDVGGWTPRPTSSPGPFELLKRQNGPTSLCGYVSGDQLDPLTCSPGDYCGFNPSFGAAGCCTSWYSVGNSFLLTGCAYHTTCFDATAASLCNQNCQSDFFVLQCTNSNFPYCKKYTFTDIGSAVLGCATANTIINVGLFYTTPTTTATFSQSVLSGPVSSPTSTISYSSSSSQLPVTIPSSVSVTGAPTPTPFTQSQQSFGGSPTTLQTVSSHVSHVSGSNRLVPPGWGVMSQWKAIFRNFSPRQVFGLF